MNKMHQSMLPVNKQLHAGRELRGPWLPKYVRVLAGGGKLEWNPGILEQFWKILFSTWNEYE